MVDTTTLTDGSRRNVIVRRKAEFGSETARGSCLGWTSWSTRSSANSWSRCARAAPRS